MNFGRKENVISMLEDWDDPVIPASEVASRLSELFAKPHSNKSSLASESLTLANETISDIASLVIEPLESLAIALEKMISVEDIRPVILPDFNLGIAARNKNMTSLNLWDFFVNNQIDISEVNKWFEKIDSKLRVIVDTSFGQYGLKAGHQANCNVLIEDKKTGARYFLVEMASGISQVLPVILALLCNKDNMGACFGLLSIKQPELHVHPKNQLILGDLLMKSVFELGNQVFIETHSEHIVLRILRKIREHHEGKIKWSNLSEDEVAIFNMNKENHGTTAKRHFITKDGDFENSWENGFFDERDGELF